MAEPGQSAPEPSELERLQAERDLKREERRRLQEELYRIAVERNRVSASQAEGQARRQPERTRLNFEANENQALGQAARGRDELNTAEEAETAARELRRRITELDATDQQDAAGIAQEMSELQIQETPVQQQVSELDQDLARLDQRIQFLETDAQAQRLRELEGELQSLGPLVDASREAAGFSAAIDLSDDYKAQAPAMRRLGSVGEPSCSLLSPAPSWAVSSCSPIKMSRQAR